jgi:hypothetical protein
MLLKHQILNKGNSIDLTDISSTLGDFARRIGVRRLLAIILDDVPLP